MSDQRTTSSLAAHEADQGFASKDQDGLTLLDLLIALGHDKKVFFLVWALGIALTIGVVLMMPRNYSASAVMLPPQSQQNSGLNFSMLSQLGPLAGLAGGVSGFKTPDGMYIELFKTRRLQDDLIKRFNLMDRYKAKSLGGARAALTSRVSLLSDKKSGLLTITVDDADAAFAAKLANAHADALAVILGELALTEAQQRHHFFDAQVGKAMSDLNKAEIAFRKAQEEGGIVVSQALAEAGVKAGVELRSRIMSREVQLQALSRFATAQSPEAQRIASELAALRKQLASVEEGSAGEDRPAKGMEAVKAYREFKVREAALESLVRQLEIAKIDEAREGPALQLIDPAVPPERASKPHRSRLVIAGAALWGVLAFLVSAYRGGVRRRVEGVDQRWQLLRQAWRGGRA
jgi:uncharacterized protein involved in exopolysaccharide biosynthesis